MLLKTEWIFPVFLLFLSREPQFMFALTFDLNQVQLFIKSMQVSVRVLFDCGGSQLNQHVPPLTLQFKDEETMPPYE